MEREKQYKNIGEISERLLVFGGVYSNLQALQSLRAVAEKLEISPKNIMCTGDVVAYCSQPEETVQLMRDWGVHSIAGNVEIQLREGQEDCGCNFEDGTTCDILSNSWYPFTKNKLSEASIDWMKTLPDFIRFTFKGKSGLVLHGSLDQTAGYIFKSTESSIKRTIFSQAQADIIIAGHCGLPFYDQYENKHWINPGVIGMPANDGTTDVWYAIMELKQGEIILTHHRMNYNHQLASKLMDDHNLPSQYSKTLLTGIWDNCDILPEVETVLQGERIEL